MTGENELSRQKPSFLRKNWKAVANIITVLALGVLIWAIRKDLAETLSNLFQVKAWFLLLMIPIQFLNYDAQARVYKGIFGQAAGRRVGYWQLMRATLELNFVNHVFPSGGVTGISYFSLRLKEYGMSVAKTTAAHFLKLILTFLSFEILIIVAVVALATKGHINSFVLLLAGSLVTATVLLTGLMMFAIGSKRRLADMLTGLTRGLNRIINVFRRGRQPRTINTDKVRSVFEDMHEYYKQYSKNPRALRGPFFWALVATVWEIATIYVVYLAFGHAINIGAVILAYAVANTAGFISVLPGGVGIYEGLMTLTLSATGVPSALSLPVTIMYRVVNTVIQIPPGYVAYHLYIKSLSPENRQRWDLAEKRALAEAAKRHE